MTRWCLFTVCLLSCGDVASPGREFRFSQRHMGTDFRLVFYGCDEQSANVAAAAAFARVAELDRCLSDYRPDSELRRLTEENSKSTSGRVPVSTDLWRVLCAAQELSCRTQGAFDVTIGPLTRLWRRARRHGRVPGADQIEFARARVGYRYLTLDPSSHSVRLDADNMRLDLGAIGKGYAADQALQVLFRHGFHRAMVDAGGDLAIGAAPCGRRGWRVAVAPLGTAEEPVGYLRLAHCGIATSGDAEQALTADGVRYSHIVDPRTGWGVRDSWAVTVVAPTAMQADALATTAIVLGLNAGLELAECTPGTAALFAKPNTVSLVTHQSPRFRALRITKCRS
jgi:thiamine biosynthesis lipoprotein